MQYLLQITNLNYDDYKNFNMKIKSGKYVLIAGSNASGKTTLIKLILGLLPTDNEIKCCGILCNYDRIKYLRHIGIVLENSCNSFLFDLVLKEMLYPLNNLHYPKLISYIRIRKILRMFHISGILYKKISDLSDLEKHKLAITLSLLHHPKLLIFDDSLLGLSDKDRESIINILKKLIRKKNITVIHFTSNLDDMLYSDLLYILDNYKIVLKGNPQKLLNEDFHQYNLNMPFMLDLSNKLKSYNLINKTYLDMDSMVRTLWK